MGLIEQSNAQYYAGQEHFGIKSNAQGPSSPIEFDSSVFKVDLQSFLNAAGDQINPTSNYDIYYKAGLRVTSFVLNNLGTGYNIGDIIAVSGGTGNGMKVKITGVNGNCVLITPGFGYLNGDVVNVGGTTGTTVNLTLSVTAGVEYVPLDNSLSYVKNKIVKLQDTTGFGFDGDFYIKLKDFAIDGNLGEYEYISIEEIVDNFLVAYVGNDKFIPNAKRSDIIFHAKRGLQEFSYDTLRSIKSQEVVIPEHSLRIPIPQDYVNYTRLSCVDNNGVQRTIYPANNITTNPTEPLLQSANGEYTQGGFGNNLEPEDSETNKRWKKANNEDLNGEFSEDYITASNIYNNAWWKTAYGQRYGLEPVTSQDNGWFTINKRNGCFQFSSNLAGNLLIIEYISDGLAYDKDTKIPKMAEQAMYMHIAHAMVSTARSIPEYIVARFKKDKRASLRNAKIRLQNLKLDTLVQVMRGKSKWIK